MLLFCKIRKKYNVMIVIYNEMQTGRMTKNLCHVISITSKIDRPYDLTTPHDLKCLFQFSVMRWQIKVVAWCVAMEMTPGHSSTSSSSSSSRWTVDLMFQRNSHPLWFTPERFAGWADFLLFVAILLFIAFVSGLRAKYLFTVQLSAAWGENMLQTSVDSC